MSIADLQPRDDAALFGLARDGDEAAFASIAERHGPSLLTFCRHMLGSRQDAEDALQQVLLDAFRALRRGDRPERPRAWLFAIARNRCTSMLRARRPADPAGDDIELVSTEGLSAEVERREDLRQLLSDLSRLPEDQRAALLLAELHDDSHADIGVALGVPPQKVKALVFQARTALIADRDARAVPCGEIQAQLATLRGAALRRRKLRRHVAVCDGCKAYEAQVAAQRRGLAILLPGAPALPVAALAGGAVATGGAATGLGALLGGAGAQVAATILVAGAGALGGLAALSGSGTDREPARDRTAPVAAAATPGAARTPVATTTRVAPARSVAATATATPVRRGRVVRVARGKVVRPPHREARRTTAAPTPVVSATAAPVTPAPAAPGRGGGSRGRSSVAPGRAKAPGTPATGHGQAVPAAPGDGASKGRAEAPGQADKRD